MPAVTINGKIVNFRVEGDAVVVDGRVIEFDLLRREPGRLLARIGNSVEEIIYIRKGDDVELFSGNATTKLEILSDRDLLMRSLDTQGSARHSHSEIKAPMPGLVVKTLVQKGDRIKRGAKLIILEAMKMENEIRTPVDAEVSDVLVAEGDIVEKDQIIITLR